MLTWLPLQPHLMLLICPLAQLQSTVSPAVSNSTHPNFILVELSHFLPEILPRSLHLIHCPSGLY